MNELLAAAGGAIIAGVLVYFALAARHTQTQASVIAERDGLLSTAKTAQAALETAQKETAELRQELTRLQGEKGELVGKLDGQVQSLEDARRVSREHQARAEDLQAKVTELESLRAHFETLKTAAEDSKTEMLKAQQDLLTKAEQVLSDKFGEVSQESLKKAGENFMALAAKEFENKDLVAKQELEKRKTAIEELLKPVAESLSALDKQNQEMEQKRVSAFDSIEKGIKELTAGADQLANVLRSPQARGNLGETILQVILERAGLVEGVNFDVQHSTDADDGGRLRADFVVHLPSGRDLIIDSKAPLDAYMKASDATDEPTRQQYLKQHAAAVRSHVKQLSSKAYWTRYKSSPECVVMFLPTEGSYQTALEHDPTLLTDAQLSRVYLANPMTVFSMIHIVAFVLKEERMNKNAEQVGKAAAQLYDSVSKFTSSIEDLGRHLRMTVADFNKAVGTLEGRVLPRARAMHALGGAAGDVIPELNPLDSLPRELASPEALTARRDDSNLNGEQLELPTPPTS